VDIQYGTYILQLRGLWVLDTGVPHYVAFIVCLPVVFGSIWFIQICIPVTPIFSIWKACRCAILITCGWMVVDCVDSADIEYLSSLSMEVVCQQCWWQRWCFQHLECSDTIIFKVWPGCFDNLFSVWNIFYDCQLVVLIARFLLYSMQVLAALPHLQTVMHHGHSIQFSIIRLSLRLQVIFWICSIQCWLITGQYTTIGRSKLPYDNVFGKGLACGIWRPLAYNIWPKGKTCLHSNNMWCDRYYLACHIGEISLLWVRVLLLSAPVGDIWYPEYTANLHSVGVVIITIQITLLPELW